MKKNRLSLLFAPLLLVTVNLNLSYAKESAVSPEKSKASAFDLPYEPTRPRSFIWPPLLSLILPGFDQWVEAQRGYAAIYTGTSILGLSLVIRDQLSLKDYQHNPFAREAPRLAFLGAQLYQTSTFMSAYHSFRTAVRTRQSLGDFDFLSHEESPLDLVLSPFRFSTITRPTTFLGLPMMLGTAILIEKLQGGKPFGSHWHVPDAADTFYSVAFSLNAGIGEETFFRGYSMPLLMYYLNSEIFSNALTALVFGALHYRSGYIPISQTLHGFYLGYLTQKNDWQIGESIFIHTWYDILAFLLTYASSDDIARSKMAFFITPIELVF